MRLDHLLSKGKVRVRKCGSESGSAMCFTVEFLRELKDLAAIRPGKTPVPIPNTTVKPREADGTALETVWESRWPPG